VEWVEITGKDLAAAKERALEQLGVAEADAEIQVIAEPKTGLFGRVRGEARVRARVKPATPRPKKGRGGRNRTKGGGRSGGGERSGNGEAKDGEQRGGSRGGAKKGSGAESTKKAGSDRGPKKETSKEETMAEGVTLEEQAAVAKEFLEGLLSTMELEATVEVRPLDDETVELAVDGEGLGMLVGPRGTTLAALQDVTRTVVQGRYAAKTDRILVDVARYRERRAAALTRFATEQAAEVVAAGEERALEPMSPADRKVVHDALNGVDGVSTRSDGEDARRHVVIVPAG
jgi:spoIIIJ-associated protein